MNRHPTWELVSVRDLSTVKDECMKLNFISYNAFTAQYNIKTNYLEYYKVVSALKHFRKKCSSNLNNPTRKYVSLLSSSNVCKKFYECVIEKKSSTPTKSQEKWLSEDAVIGNLEVNWENTYRLPFLN